MIGETIKIGFDGQQVTKGLGGIMGGFRKLRSGIGSVMKETGRGAALTLGNSLFNAVSNLAMAIPNELKSLADLNKELEVMNITTGILPEKYLALRSAMSQATGKGLEDAGDDLRDFAERIDEARRDWDSSAAVGMRRLNIFSMDLKDKTIDEQLATIGEKVKAFEDKNGKGKSIFPLREAFGDQAANWLPLLLDMNGYMERNAESAASFAKRMEESKEALQNINAIRSALSQKLSDLSIGFLQGLKAGGLEIQSITDAISKIDIAKGMEGIATSIKSNLNEIQRVGVWQWMADKMAELGDMLKKALLAGAEALWAWFQSKMSALAEWIGDAISSGIKAGLDGIPLLKGLIKTTTSTDGVTTSQKNATAKTTENPIMKLIEENTARTTRILERIGMKNTSTSTFA